MENPPNDVVASDSEQTKEDQTHDLHSLLCSSERDFLIRNNGDQVKFDCLKGKKVGLYFSASWCGPCQQFTPSLVEVYNELSSKGDFEIVFVSADEDDEAFKGYFSKMPWLAIPFSDSKTRDHLDKLFKVMGIPYLVIIDESGKVSTDEGVEIIREYGVDAYPFCSERVKEIKDQEEAARREQSLKSILVSRERDFVISADGKEVSISELEGKTVGLYFSLSSFTPKLIEVYEELKSKGEKFEVVMIPMDDEEESFKQGFEKMPWFSLPFKDKSCVKLARYFERSSLPSLVIIGPDGKTLCSDVVEIIREYGVDAYPFSPERVKEIKDQEEAAWREQPLKSILVSQERDFVISADGKEVSVSELEGKTVGLYFSKKCLTFTPKLIEVYEELKSKGEKFEVVMIPLDDDEESFKQGFENMPWFSLPFKDKSCMMLARYFEPSSLPLLVIIGPDGKTLCSDVVETVKEHGTLAYPFTPEKFAELEEIEKAKREAQTLESILVSKDLDFVIGKDGLKVPVSDLAGKTILIYFSSHWRPSWHDCLPLRKLVEVYQQIKAKDDAFEVIFISLDSDLASFEDFFSRMPWLALPFGDERKESLSRTFKVGALPRVEASTLVALDPKGRTVTTKALELVLFHGADAYPFTKERLKEIGWHGKVKTAVHVHELVLTQRAPYVCDGCEEAGRVLSFYCGECHFDLHPKCALEEAKGTKGDTEEDGEGKKGEEG